MQSDITVIKQRDIDILSNKEYDKLEQILHEINRNFVRIEDDDRRRNVECFKTCVDNMINRMKNVNQTFKDLFQEVKYTGSFYEGSRVQEPNEFDINLVLRKPFDVIIHEDNYTHPGYVRLKLNQQVVQTTQNRDQCRWIQNGFISAQAVNRWLEGVISTVFYQANAAGSTIGVNGIYSVRVLTKSGPAITLRMRHVNANRSTEEIDVDFVPVFEFQHPTWPKKTRNIPPACSKSTKWCVTPKVEYDPSNWRLSFAFLEREMIHDKPNLKNIYRIMKRLRDCSVNLKNIKSYQIKSLFLWKVSLLGTEQWRKSMGRIFIMMLFELEDCLKSGEIPFFWDKRMNMIGMLRYELKRDMYGQITNIRAKICRLLSENKIMELQDFMRALFTAVRVQGFDYTNLNAYEFEATNLNRDSAQSELQSSSWSCVVS